ncbi:hypothetical protein EV2_022844 [Malus domestica]
MEVLQQYFGGAEESSPKEDASGDDMRFIDVDAVKGVDFLESWKKIEARFKDEAVRGELLQEVVFGLWRIWKYRNALAFEGTYKTPKDAIDLSQSHIQEFRDAQLVKTREKEHCGNLQRRFLLGNKWLVGWEVSFSMMQLWLKRLQFVQLW